MYAEVGDEDEDMNQRCAYVDTQILFMSWNGQKDGWVPDLTTMQQHRDGQLRIYEPSDGEGYVVTMPGHVRWPTKFDGDDIREVLELPWVPSALQGMREDEIDELDTYRTMASNLPPILQIGIQINAPLTLVELDIPSLFEERMTATILASMSQYPKPIQSQIRPPPPPLPKHIQTVVLERAESEGHTCPITLTPIKSATATVTSCGHIFQTAAIQEWLSENQTCPECRQICSV
jgi:hypothetical protein